MVASYLRTVDPQVCEDAIELARSGGPSVGANTIRQRLGWSVHESRRAMHDLLDLHRGNLDATAGWTPQQRILSYRRAMEEGTRILNVQGGTGYCRCLMCRSRGMWATDMEEALSEW